jgi:hypothetical protein
MFLYVDKGIFSCIGCYSIFREAQALQKCSKCDWMVCSKECEKVFIFIQNQRLNLLKHLTKVVNYLNRIWSIQKMNVKERPQ